jgi:signal transduction histidine kinase
MTSALEHGRARRWTILAVTLFALVLTEIVVGLVGGAALGLSFAQFRDSFVLTNSAIGLSCGVAGALIAWQRPHNPVGWLLLASAVFQAGTALTAPFLLSGVHVPLVATVAAYSWPWSIALCLPLALLVFPDGRLPSRRWRVVLAVAVAESVLFAVEVGSMPVPGQHPAWLVITNYDSLGWLWTISELANGAVYLACLASLVVRYRRGDDRLRRQLLWLALAVLVVIVMFTVWVPAVEAGPLVLILLAIPLIPAAITIAVLRYQLLDIRLVVSRAVLYALLTAAVIGSYVGLVAVADTARRQVGLGSSVLATLVIALLFNPVRVWLQRLVDRALYGDRTNPVRAVSRLGKQLGSGTHADPEDELRVVCDTLRLPYAALRAGDLERGSHGTMPKRLETVALDYRGERVGELVVGVRAGEAKLNAADRSVLELLAIPLAVAVRATTLSEAVQQSREQIVTAQEEERRRLRRDLHDGLGPLLTGVAFQTDAARNLLRTNPDRADALLADLRDRTSDAISDVRRLVFELRPPTLDELGLTGALRRHAEQLDGPRTRVTVVAPEELPRLPAAVEVAAFRISLEALTNAVRHSDATHIQLSIAVDDGLRIEVTDDGKPTASWQPGVGLTSMYDRAAELGGNVQAGPQNFGGLVLVRLPI